MKHVLFPSDATKAVLGSTPVTYVETELNRIIGGTTAITLLTPPTLIPNETLFYDGSGVLAVYKETAAGNSTLHTVKTIAISGGRSPDYSRPTPQVVAPVTGVVSPGWVNIITFQPSVSGYLFSEIIAHGLSRDYLTRVSMNGVELNDVGPAEVDVADTIIFSIYVTESDQITSVDSNIVIVPYRMGVSSAGDDYELAARIANLENLSVRLTTTSDQKTEIGTYMGKPKFRKAFTFTTDTEVVVPLDFTPVDVWLIDGWVKGKADSETRDGTFFYYPLHHRDMTLLIEFQAKVVDSNIIVNTSNLTNLPGEITVDWTES